MSCIVIDITVIIITILLTPGCNILVTRMATMGGNASTILDPANNQISMYVCRACPAILPSQQDSRRETSRQ